MCKCQFILLYVLSVVVQYLWPLLQKFSNSRGQQLMLSGGNDLPFSIDLERYEQDEPAHLPQQLDSFKHLSRAVETTTSTNSGKSLHEQQHNTMNNKTSSEESKLEKLQVDLAEKEVSHNALNARLHATKYQQSENDPSTNITYEWHVGPWSTCSPKCGKTPGKRVREISCLRHAYKDDLHASMRVHVDHCLSTITPAPKAMEVCPMVAECPVWQPGSWTPCKQSRCLGRHIAVQKRDVRCQYASNASDALDCEYIKKPISRKECYNPRCKGVWRVEPWSECNAPCGLPGIKYRILQCVWYGTRRPAGNACKNQSRPAVMKACKRLSCYSVMTAATTAVESTQDPSKNFDEDEAESETPSCVDTSRYCRNVRVIGMCRLHRYQQQCCNSCKINNFN